MSWLSAGLSGLLLASLTAAYSVPLHSRAEDVDLFPTVKRYAAIGDSYSAGIGAGTERNEEGAKSCHRFDESYPSILDQDERLGGHDAHEFTYLACSGDESPQVLEQAKKLQGEYDLITISAGGNDLGFSDIVQSCIYRIFTAQDCEEPLQTAELALENKKFEKNIELLLNEAKKHLAKGGQIYYTGYGKFFNADTTQCNKVDWSLTPSSKTAKLDQRLRERTNKLVDRLNDKLAGWVDKAGGKFVNYDQYTGGWLQRFCDEGVKETRPWVDNGEDAWNQMWFQMRLGVDALKNAAIEMRKKRGVKTSDDLDDYQPEEMKFSDLDTRGLPVGALKVFHPTPVLNAFISNLIVQMMVERRARDKDVDVSIEKVPLKAEKGTCKVDLDTDSDGAGDSVEEDKVVCNSEDRRAISGSEFFQNIQDVCDGVEDRFKSKDWPYSVHTMSQGTIVELNIKKQRSDAKLPNKEQCITYLKKTLDDCRKGKKWKKGGYVIHDGIKYESVIRLRDHLWCENGKADLSANEKFDVSTYKGIAEDWCDSGITRKAGESVSAFTHSSPIPTAQIKLSISMSDNQDGCLGPKEYKPSKEECVDKFMKLLGDCKEKDGKSYGAGGVFDTPSGCVTYDVNGWKKKDFVNGK
ncbi:SGNH hydrolase [Aspergillus taichungensis]|uniref:SGNH hydrolase n=1 Tax=Aspergillus taichungensis TaxID=482145 RepID=A0A2J5HTS3_9EURO|nr:SGNH hydrolase [Aspergillus taichungensis]